MAARFSKPGQWGHGIAELVEWYEPGELEHKIKTAYRWTGRVELDEAKLTLPLRWRSPRCIFVNSTSDLFHEKLPDSAICKVFAVMAMCPQHRFIVLTKRDKRMRAWVTRLAESCNAIEELCDAAVKIAGSPCAANIIEDTCIPLPNVVLGVSVEDQATANERIPHLLATPAACRMVSAEPLLGPVDLTNLNRRGDVFEDALEYGIDLNGRRSWPSIDWVVAGSESGPRARLCDLDWIRSLRDQCSVTSTAFFWKQHVISGRKTATPELDGRKWISFPSVA